MTHVKTDMVSVNFLFKSNGTFNQHTPRRPNSSFILVEEPFCSQKKQPTPSVLTLATIQVHIYLDFQTCCNFTSAFYTVVASPGTFSKLSQFYYCSQTLLGQTVQSHYTRYGLEIRIPIIRSSGSSFSS